MVPHAEVPLLPVRLVVEPVAGRSGAGRRRRQPELHVQPVRHVRRRHHVAAGRAKHRRSVPVLARRRRPPDRRRILQRARTPTACGSRASCRQRLKYMAMFAEQPERPRRQRDAARQQARHAVLHAAVAADDGRVRAVRDLRRLRRSPEGRHEIRRAFHAQPRGQTGSARHELRSRTARSG